MDFSAQRQEAIRKISPIGCKTQALRSNCINQPPASQKCAVFRGALWSDVAGSSAGSLVKRRLDHLGRAFDSSEEVVIIKFEDYWVNALEKRVIDFVKIDVEGFEFAALKGFGKAILDTAAVQFEFGGTQIDTRTFFQDFWYFFKDVGFTIFRICPEPQRLFPVREYSEALESFEYQNYIGINGRFAHLLELP